MQVPSVVATNRLTSAVTFDGPGLFTGAPCRVTIRPGDGSGTLALQRVRADGGACGESFVGDVRAACSPPPGVRNTTLAPGGDASRAPAEGVMTTEHLYSALAVLRIFDARLEVVGPEMPMMDNSALPFLEGLRKSAAPGGPMLAGLRCPATTIEDPRDPAVRSELAPPYRATGEGEGDVKGEGGGEDMSNGEADLAALDLQYEVDYGDGSGLPRQTAEFRLPLVTGDALDAAARAYREGIAPARTFCTEQEAQLMRSSGRFAHLREGDVLVIGQAGPVGTTLRLPNEPAAHKLLDLLGDLHLAGRPIVGAIRAHKTGHHHNRDVCRLLLGLPAGA